MMIKAFNITLGVLVGFSVWCAALVVAVLALHVVAIAAFTVYHLVNS